VFKDNPIIFTKTPDIPSTYKWCVGSNASRGPLPIDYKQRDSVAIHFNNDILCVLVSEFEKQGIDLHEKIKSGRNS